MSDISEPNPASFEYHEQTVFRLRDKSARVVPGRSYILDSAKASEGDQSEVLAEIVTNPGGDTEEEHLFLVDLRSLPTDEAGFRSYQGQNVSANVQYMLIDPTKLDWEQGVGFKGLRPNESMVYGREGTTDRYPGMSKATSRKHFSLRVGPDGTVYARDEHSTNGTEMRTGNAVAGEVLTREMDDGTSLGRMAVEVAERSYKPDAL